MYTTDISKITIKGKKITLEQLEEIPHHNVCVDCGVQFLPPDTKGGVATFWKGECCLCKDTKAVTDIRRYNYLRAK